ncbi:MAG: hypothetical protein ACOYJC_09720 [Christensenellales bacterium]
MYQHTSDRKKRRKKKKLLSWALVLLMVTVAVLAVVFLIKPQAEPGIEFRQLNAKKGDTLYAMPQGMLILSGDTLTYYDEEEEPFFETKLPDSQGVKLCASDAFIVAYKSSQIQVLSIKGEVLFSKEPGNIQMVRADQNNVGVLCAMPDGTDVLRVYDVSGEEVGVLEYKQKVMDFGFTYGNMLWVLELDTTGVMLSSRITTYKGGGNSINGVIHIDAQVVENIFFSTQSIYTVGTSHMIGSNYVGEKTNDALIHGWELQDANIQKEDPAVFLLAPRGEGVGTQIHTAARVEILGQKPHTVQLPPDCIRLKITENGFYAFTPKKLYAYNLSCELTGEMPLPFEPEWMQEGAENSLYVGQGVDVYEWILK